MEKLISIHQIMLRKNYDPFDDQFSDLNRSNTLTKIEINEIWNLLANKNKKFFKTEQHFLDENYSLKSEDYGDLRKNGF